jgi:hypothetical protein
LTHFARLIAMSSRARRSFLKLGKPVYIWLLSSAKEICGASMLDGVSLDQLRTFIAAVDETVGNLEEQIGVVHLIAPDVIPR